MKTIRILLTALCAVAALSCAKEQGDRFYKLRNHAGMEVTVTNYGGRIVSVVLPDRDGVKRDVVLGFETVEAYYPENNRSEFGAAIGRYANRIARGRFTLDGVEYELPQNNLGHCLHGGPEGWQYKPFRVVEADARHIRLRVDSPEGDNGFPGAVTAYVTYTLTDDNSLEIAYEAVCSAPTVINMTNHSFFNLSGDPAGHSVLDDELYVNASQYTPVDATLMTTGEILPVAGTPMDFTEPRRIGEGYDHNWVLDTEGDLSRVAAELYCPLTGIDLKVYTDEPGLQVYTGNALDGSQTGKGGVAYASHSGICLETQHYPDSPNKPEWPSTVLRPGQTYRSHTVYAFSVR